MSYASVAASGPKQTADEKYSFATYSRAPAPPQVEHHDPLSTTTSTVDVDSPHIISVDSSFTGETDTQARRLELEAEDEKKKFAQAEEHAKQKARELKGKAEDAAKKAEKKAKKAGDKIEKNSDNPVFLGNAILIGVGAVALGYGAYQKHTKGELNWQVAGTWTAVVGAFAVGDYFASKWLLENRFPAK